MDAISEAGTAHISRALSFLYFSINELPMSFYLPWFIHFLLINGFCSRLLISSTHRFFIVLIHSRHSVVPCAFVLLYYYLPFDEPHRWCEGWCSRIECNRLFVLFLIFNTCSYMYASLRLTSKFRYTYYKQCNIHCHFCLISMY